MSEYENDPHQELRAACGAAIIAGFSRKEVDDVCIKYGATAGMHTWRRVTRIDACKAELTQMVQRGNGAQPSPELKDRTRRRAFATAPQTLESVRRDAFSKMGSPVKDKPKPLLAGVGTADDVLPQAFDEAAVAKVYDRWNNPRPVGNLEDDDGLAEYMQD